MKNICKRKFQITKDIFRRAFEPEAGGNTNIVCKIMKSAFIIYYYNNNVTLMKNN